MVKDIRRQTRRHSSAEDKIRIVLEGLRGDDSIAALADAPRNGDPEANVRNLCRALLALYENADDLHRVQMNSLEILPGEQAAEIHESERRIVTVFSAAIAALDDKLANDRKLLIPVTMSLLGMLNWAFMWFRPGRGMTRAEYADLAATLTIEGIRKLG